MKVSVKVSIDLLSSRLFGEVRFAEENVFQARVTNPV